MEHHLQGGAAEPIGIFQTKDGFMNVNARRGMHRDLCRNGV